MSTQSDRLNQIANIIEHVDERCMVADGPVIPTQLEMTSDEMRKIYTLAKGTKEDRALEALQDIYELLSPSSFDTNYSRAGDAVADAWEIAREVVEASS